MFRRKITFDSPPTPPGDQIANLLYCARLMTPSVVEPACRGEGLRGGRLTLAAFIFLWRGDDKLSKEKHRSSTQNKVTVIKRRTRSREKTEKEEEEEKSSSKRDEKLQEPKSRRAAGSLQQPQQPQQQQQQQQHHCGGCPAAPHHPCLPL